MTTPRGLTFADTKEFREFLKATERRHNRWWLRLFHRRRGIHARTYLPSPTYDSCFELRLDQIGRTLCVMKPSSLDYDKDYWEEVPEPLSSEEIK